MILLIEVVVFGVLAVVGIVFGRAVDPEARRIFAIVLAANVIPMGLLAFLLLKWTMKTRLDERCLSIRFFPFRETIPLEHIAHWEARTYRPVREYGGWGVRFTFGNGRAYNVRGDRGVQLVLANGKRILIGSQRADELNEAISRAKQSSQVD